MPTTYVLGVGPGLGAAVARRFAREGHSVALAQSLARELQPQGIHVAHIVIDGQIDTPRARAMFPGRDASTYLAPDAIAETYWHLHAQHPTSWTLEIDLRPTTEKF